jgi:glycosyltransferase involved in cell wall biosynthesis
MEPVALCSSGRERVVACLAEQLVGRGHQVTVFASGDSSTSARLVPVVDQALGRHTRYQDSAPFEAIALGKLARDAGSFDVIHSHIEIAGFPLARCLPGPMVSTIYGRLDVPEMIPLYGEFADVPLVSVSEAQRRPVPYANWVGTVYPGIEDEVVRFQTRPGAYLAFLGPFTPDAGLDTAIRVACRAGMPLKVATHEMPAPERDPNAAVSCAYYEEVIKPLLRKPGVEFVGEIAGAERDRFLGDAAGLLYPLRWPEPFGLTIAESLACGTPVVALQWGCVLEVLEHGTTGFIVETEDELVAAVQALGSIDRNQCRLVAERCFSAAVMALRYERIYAALLTSAEAPDPAIACPNSQSDHTPALWPAA